MSSLRLGEDEENQRSDSIYHSHSKSQQSLPSPPLSLQSSPAPPEPSHFNLQDDSKDGIEWVSFISQHSKAEKGKGRELVEKHIREEVHSKGNFVFERDQSEVSLSFALNKLRMNGTRLEVFIQIRQVDIRNGS